MLSALAICTPLILISGLIAYLGDLLGRLLGKRRLTLWGLRPKHTAILLSCVTGALIATLTLLALVALDANFRVALTRGAALRAENNRLLTDGKRLRADLDSLQAHVAALMEQNRKTLASNAGLRKANGLLSTDFKKLSDRNATLDARNRALDAEIASRGARIASLNTEIAAKKLSNYRLVGRNQELRRDNRLLVTDNGRLEASNRRLARENSNALRVLGDRERAFQDQERRIADRDRQLEQLKPLESRPLAITTGTELARAIVSPELRTEEEYKVAVYAFLEQVDERLRRRGAASLTMNDFAFRLSPVERLTSAHVDQTATRLARLNGEAFLRARAVSNSPQGQPAQVALEVMPNRVAFTAGDHVASVEVDGSAEDSEIWNRLLSFLGNDVRDAAIRRKVEPDSDGQIGSLDYAPLLEVLRKVKQSGGLQIVKAVAAEDVRASGPLALRFEVETVPRQALAPAGG